MIKRVLGFGFLAFAGLGGFFLLATAHADAQTETILHSFGSQPGDGAFPYGGLLYKKGNLYGTTHATAPNGNLGNVFEITAGGQYKVLYNFGSQPGDGTAPRDFGGLAFRGGKLYGTTFEGGATGVGTVFDLTLKGKEKVLHTFGVQSGDGVYPAAGVIFDKAGNLYGTTEEGGPYNSFCGGGCGIVYEVTKTGEEKVLYSFGAQFQDAAFPIANLTFDKAGNLYGTTGTGGLYQHGAVFELSPTGAEKLVYSFGGQSSDGINPYGSVVFDRTGNLYGTTFAGGLNGQGTVFELSPTGEEKILYTFGSQAGDGNTPIGGLVLDTAGNLYGVTAYGGANGFGTVFEITP
jgi:uncharacterized repeat protein (TIGR03803 family)